MFDLSKEPIFSSSTRLATLALAALASAVIGACFNGNDADGLPCNDNKQCGPGTECINGYCAGLFLCGSGELLDATDVCDVDIDCEDGSDEDSDVCGGGGAGINQCVEPVGDLSYRVGVSRPGPGNAYKVVAADIQGMPTIDAISATLGDTGVRIQFDLGTSDPLEYVLPGMSPAWGERTVFGFEPAKVDGDDKTDLVVVTAGIDGAALYVYRNTSGPPPEQFGAESLVPAVAGAMPRSFAIGQLNDDDYSDIVGIVDIGDQHGTLLVGLGDPNQAMMGGTYFGETVEGGPIPYDEFVDAALADANGDGLDDLLIVGIIQGMGPVLLVVHREVGDVGWTIPIPIGLDAPGRIAVGRLGGSQVPGEPLGPRPDVAILAPNDKAIQPLLNNMMGMLQPRDSIELQGDNFTGLAIADMNCDGQGDFVYGLTTPNEIRVLFGNGEGGVVTNIPLVYADEGTPRGGIDIALFDGDPAPDIFTAADQGDGQPDSQVRILVSSAE